MYLHSRPDAVERERERGWSTYICMYLYYNIILMCRLNKRRRGGKFRRGGGIFWFKSWKVILAKLFQYIIITVFFHELQIISMNLNILWSDDFRQILKACCGQCNDGMPLFENDQRTTLCTILNISNNWGNTFKNVKDRNKELKNTKILLSILWRNKCN